MKEMAAAVVLSDEVKRTPDKAKTQLGKRPGFNLKDRRDYPGAADRKEVHRS